jgi:hypothetical protein
MISFKFKPVYLQCPLDRRLGLYIVAHSGYRNGLIDSFIYGSTAICWALAACTQSVGLLGRGISPSYVRYLHTGQLKNRINANRH